MKESRTAYLESRRPSRLNARDHARHVSSSAGLREAPEVFRTAYRRVFGLLELPIHHARVQPRQPEIGRSRGADEKMREARRIVPENVWIVVRRSPPLVRRRDPRCDSEPVNADCALAEIEARVR